jgi:hypothetical protein
MQSMHRRNENGPLCAARLRCSLIAFFCLFRCYLRDALVVVFSTAWEN